MFSRMDIPNTEPARKPFRFQAKWIALFVAFDVLVMAIALWVVFGRQRVDDHLVYLGEDELRLGSDVICPVIVNSRDRFPDFPDTVWSGFQIVPLKIRLSEREDVKTGTFRLGAISSMPFEVFETILRTVRGAGVAHLELVDSLGSVPIALRDASQICSQAGMVVDCTPLEDFGKESPSSWFVERSGTLWFHASGQGRSIARSVPMPRGDVDPEAVSLVRDSVRSWIRLPSPGDTLGSVGILFSPRDSFQKVMELARLVSEASGKQPWIGKQPQEIDPFL
jgi:hypothetical protein